MGGAVDDLDDLMPSFAPDTPLGHYRIVEQIGAGGMGVVYKATDTKLHRSVALKVVRPELLQDDGRKRLEREARALASLNHPRVAAIHGLEESGDVSFLVLEYVPGPTLADRLKRGALPVRDAMGIARQMAEALEAAHARGIMHRDLKPANIKITDDGQVKVLDFGLAKSLDRPHEIDSDAGVTISAMTKEMLIVGTAGYMSPEQACGKRVDTRTDIWAFGCILYEMLAGQTAFRGDTLGEIMAATIEREPDWQALPAATPPTIVSLLRRCLRKDPQSRLRDIGDARIELDEALSDSAPVVPVSSGVSRRTMIGTLAGAAIGAAAAGIAIRRYRGAVPRSLTRFAIAMPEGEPLVTAFASRLSIAPDGSRIAFITRQGAPSRVYLHAVSDLESKLLKDLNSGYSFFSPDSRWLGYFTANPSSMRKMALSGGAPVTIFPRPAATGNSGATWADDDTIYFVSEIPGGLMSVPASGGEPKEIRKIDAPQGETTLKYPCALPGGRTVLYTVGTNSSESFDDAHIAALSIRTGQTKVLVEGGTQPRYSPSGHLVYARSGALLAVPFDPDRLEVSGQPATVLEGVLMSRNTGVANFDISATGDLVYVPGICEGGARTLHWVNRDGHPEKLPLPARSYLHPRISPDSRKLAIEIEGSHHDCYVYDFASGVLSNITADGVSHWPLWSADGRTIGYRAGTMGHFSIWQVLADRSRPPEQVRATGFTQNAESYSPDGRFIAYTAAEPNAPAKVVTVALDGDRKPERLDNSKYAEGSPKFSPDGRWLAYCSNESGKPEVYVQAFPGPGPKTQVSNDGGTDPVWKRSGGELFYRNGDSMMAVRVSTASGFTASRPLELWRGHYSHGMSASCGPPGFSSSNYDVTADGQRFLMIKDDDQDSATSKQIIVVQGWADEVTRLSSRT
jgi:serine/threonine-protein kinase